MAKITSFNAILFAAVICGAFASPSYAVTINMINNDGAGEGFNDPTPGTDRINAFNFALDIWEALLAENYPSETINVAAEMNPLGGSTTSAILGSAGPNTIHRDFVTADPEFVADTWYAGPLANHLSGFDRDLISDEIDATFNSDVDNGTVFGSIDWYYGTDENSGSDIDFVTVVLHEIGHGLNFIDLIDAPTNVPPSPGTGA